MKVRGNKTLRRIDATLGRFLVVFLSLFKRRKKILSNLHTIGLFKLVGIGDLILLGGIIRDIKRCYPKSKIILFCGSDNKEIAFLLPGVDEVIPLSIRAPLKSLRIFRKYSLSLLFDFGQWSRIEALFSFFSKSLYTIGFQTKKQHRHYLYDRVCLHDGSIHEIDNFRNLVKQIGIESNSLTTISLKEEKLCPEISKIVQEKCILFHPWSAGILRYLKEWPLPYWIKLGKILIMQGYHILISGSQKDHIPSHKIVEEINTEKNSNVRAFNIAGKFSINQLGHIIRASRCVISINTGIMHFASCFKIPLIALHGPVAVHRWGSFNPEAIDLSSDCPGCGYISLGFECPNDPPQCMEDISVEKVLKALENKGLIQSRLSKII